MNTSAKECISKRRSIKNFVLAVLLIVITSTSPADADTKKFVYASSPACNLVTQTGRDLNPYDYVFKDPKTCDALMILFEAIVEILGNDDFVFIVTGGDRVKDTNGVIFSATDGKPVKASADASQHLAGKAADVRVRRVDASVMRRAVARSPFANGFAGAYADGHWHYGFSR